MSGGAYGELNAIVLFFGSITQRQSGMGVVACTVTGSNPVASIF